MRTLSLHLVWSLTSSRDWDPNSADVWGQSHVLSMLFGNCCLVYGQALRQLTPGNSWPRGLLNAGYEDAACMGWRPGCAGMVGIPQPRTRMCSSPSLSGAGCDHSDSPWAGPTQLLDAGPNTLVFTQQSLQRDLDHGFLNRSLSN